MKNTFLVDIAILSLVAVAATTACSPDSKELIVGNWDVQSVYSVVDDHTAGTHEEATRTPSDANYVGYDEVEFNADGTSRWHMSARYYRDGMFDEPYKDFNWHLTGDSLFVYRDGAEDAWVGFGIKELDRNILVIESYSNNEYPRYNQHHIETTVRYTLKHAR